MKYSFSQRLGTLIIGGICLNLGVVSLVSNSSIALWDTIIGAALIGQWSIMAINSRSKKMSLKPVYFSNQTFEDLKSSLNEIRQRVHSAWLAHGPGTTREVAAAAGIDLLTFRPRTTELFHLGLIELLENVRLNEGNNHQGVYRARSMEQWEKFVAAKRIPANPQLSLTV
jgi:hypothetical protein